MNTYKLISCYNKRGLVSEFGATHDHLTLRNCFVDTSKKINKNIL